MKKNKISKASSYLLCSTAVLTSLLFLEHQEVKADTTNSANDTADSKVNKTPVTAPLNLKKSTDQQKDTVNNSTDEAQADSQNKPTADIDNNANGSMTSGNKTNNISTLVASNTQVKETTTDDDDFIYSKWGTATISFDKTNNILTVESGTLANLSTSNYVDEENLIEKHIVKQIKFKANVIAPMDSSSIFRGFDSLSQITGNLNTSNVSKMKDMFFLCSSLTNLDVSEWDTSNVTDMDDMFYGDTSLIDLDVSKWHTSNVVYMNNLFSGCSSLTNLEVGEWDTSKVTSMAGVFYGDTSLTNLDVSKWDTSNVTDMHNLFYSCSSLTNLEVGEWDTSKVTSMAGMFYGDASLINLDVSKWDTSNVTYMSSLFSGCSSLTNLDVSEWNTSNVTYMSSLFSECSSLTNLDVSKWNTSNVTYISNIFMGAASLTNLDVSKWDTSNMVEMHSAFARLSSLSSLDVSKWNTSKVIDMYSMFESDKSLTNLDISHFDTSKVTDMELMFYGDSLLTELDVSHFDTSKVTKMFDMFNGCSSLASLDFSRWDTSKVNDMNNMFSFTNKLSSIILGLESKFNVLVALPPITNNKYTGRWIRIDPEVPKIIYANSDSFMREYDGLNSGTYVWEKKSSEFPDNPTPNPDNPTSNPDNPTSNPDNPIAKNDYQVLKVIYTGKGKVRLLNSAGTYLDKYVKNNAEYIIWDKKTINNELMYLIGTNDEWIPSGYSNIISKASVIDQSINIIYSGKGKVRLLNSEGKYLDKYISNNDSYPILDTKNINNSLMYRINKQDMWVPATYTATNAIKSREVTVNYLPNWGIAVWNEPAGNLTGQFLKTGTKQTVIGYALRNTGLWAQVGKNEWVDANYLN